MPAPILKITSPGSIPAIGNAPDDSFIKRCLDFLIDYFYEANQALLLFDEASVAERFYHSDEAKGHPIRSAPYTFINRAPQIHARTFIYALDMFRAMLEILSNDAKCPTAALLILLAEFDNKLQNVRAIRNSAHHMEDRIRGLKSWNRPINLEPIADAGMVTDGKTIVLDYLDGNRYMTMIESGEFVGIDVTVDSMLKLQSIFQKVLNAFTWKGFPIEYPNWRT